MALPAFARRTPLLQQSIDISCLPFPQQQTCSSVFAAVDPCWDRRTDRPTDTAYYASCANKPDINGSVVRFLPLAVQIPQHRRYHHNRCRTVCDCANTRLLGRIACIARMDVAHCCTCCTLCRLCVSLCVQHTAASPVKTDKAIKIRGRLGEAGSCRPKEPRMGCTLAPPSKYDRTVPIRPINIAAR